MYDAGFVSSHQNDPYAANDNGARILDKRFRSFIIFSIARRKTAPRLSARWRHVLQRSMMTLSDGHLITGLAILVAAFSQARSITIYHFNISVYLAWLSFSVHMVTLSICRPIFQDRPAYLYWRLASAGLLFVLLLSGLALTSSRQSPQNNRFLQDDYWLSDSTSPKPPPPFFMDSAIMCTWSCGNLNSWPADTIIAFVLISLGFFTRCVRLTPSASRLWHRFIIEKAGSAIRAAFDESAHCRAQSQGKTTRAFWAVVLWAVCVVYLNARALVDIFGSLFGEMYWLSILLLWGASKLLVLRFVSPLSPFENNWGFGQVLPLFLLLAPFAAIPEIYMCKPHGNCHVATLTLLQPTTRPNSLMPTCHSHTAYSPILQQAPIRKPSKQAHCPHHSIAPAYQPSSAIAAPHTGQSSTAF
jgi:hypothetical protein